MLDVAPLCANDKMLPLIERATHTSLPPIFKWKAHTSGVPPWTFWKTEKCCFVPVESRRKRPKNSCCLALNFNLGAGLQTWWFTAGLKNSHPSARVIMKQVESDEFWMWDARKMTMERKCMKVIEFLISQRKNAKEWAEAFCPKRKITVFTFSHKTFSYQICLAKMVE